MNKRGHLFLLVIVLLPLFSLMVYAAQPAACKFPVAVVSTPEEEMWATRLQDALADSGSDVTLRIERAPEFEDAGDLLSTKLPVAIPPGAAKTGEKHLVTLDELVRKSDFKQAQKYLAKNRGEMIFEDAAKIEQFLDAQRRAQENMIGELNNWLKTEQGQIYLHTGDGIRWYERNKATWWKKWLWKANEVDVERMVKNGYELPEEFLRPATKKKIISPDLSVFDYDSLQVMHILGISPTEAAQQHVRIKTIARVYKEEIGDIQFLKQGELTPGLKRLIGEGHLTREQGENLRAGVPMVMGGLDRPTLEKQVIWQLRDQFIDGGIDDFVRNPSSGLVIEFGKNVDFPAYDIILTRERWNEFLGKHIYGTYNPRFGEAPKSLLPEEFKDPKIQKELLDRLIKIMVREQGDIPDPPGTKRIITKTIVIQGHSIKWKLSVELSTNKIGDFHFLSFNKIRINGP